MNSLWIFVLILAGILFLALLAFFGSRLAKRPPKEDAGDRKGRLGENSVAEVLARCAIKGDILLNNVVLTNRKTGVSNEIDHILLSTRGIFVVETKTRAGEIRGDDYDDQWEQILGRGDVRHAFRSPVLQNEAHVSKVKAVTGCKEVENVVVFAQGNVERVRSDYVHTLDELPAFLASRPEGALTPRERDAAKNRLLKLMKESDTPEEHRKKMREKYGDEE